MTLYNPQLLDHVVKQLTSFPFFALKPFPIIVGREFDLSSLTRDGGYTMDDGDGRDFVINVCAPLPNAGCGDTVGESIERRGSRKDEIGEGD